VLRFSRPKGCRPAGPLIDIDEVNLRGAYALTIEGGKVSVSTVADARGDRPWVQKSRAAATLPALEWSNEDGPGRGRRHR
jgi:hypothetical protein